MKRFITCFSALLFFLKTLPAYANNITINTNNIKNALILLWGSTPDDRRLYLGMRSFHTTNKDRNSNNQLIGFSYHTFAAGTFVNSYYRRGYTVGLQRFWLTGSLKHDVTYQLGYRIGLVSGYQGHNLTGIEALRNSPVIPYIQLLFDLNWKYFGLEFSTSSPYVLATSFYIRF